MARNMLPMRNKGGIGAKIIWLVVGLAVLMLVVRYPGDVAGWVRDAVGLLTGVVNGVVAFFRQLGH